MNKWLRRAVGTVGIAWGVWLLGSGAAHADATTDAFAPQHLYDTVSGLFAPTGGPNNQALSLLTPATEAVTGPLSFSHGAGTVAGQQENGLLDALPITDVLPPTGTENGLGLPLVGALPIDGLLPLGELRSGGLPVAGTLTRSLPLDATSLPGVGGLARDVPLDALSHPGDAMDAAGGLTDSLPVFDSLTGALPLSDVGNAAGTTEDLPVVGSLLGGGVLGGLPVVGGLLSGLPIVGSAAGTPTEDLPVVGSLLPGDSGLPVLGPMLGDLPVGGVTDEALPIFDSLPLVSSVA